MGEVKNKYARGSSESSLKHFDFIRFAIEGPHLLPLHP